MRLLFLISLASTCAACATPSARPAEPGRVAIPASLLHCAGEPAVPDPDTATDVDVARWQLDLLAAGCDCRDKLAAVKALQDGAKPPVSRCTVR